MVQRSLISKIFFAVSATMVALVLPVVSTAAPLPPPPVSVGDPSLYVMTAGAVIGVGLWVIKKK